MVAIMATRFGRLSHRARCLRIDAHALYLAARDPRVPWSAKLVAAAVAAYAFSPIDLIPDFVPILGFVDELIILPLGIAVALRLVSADIVSDCRKRAADAASRPISRAAAVAIVVIWIATLVLIAVAFVDVVG